MIRKHVFCIICAIFSIAAYAQDGELKGVINTDNFPEVSFIWHEYNHKPLKASAFDLSEDGKDVSCKVVIQEPTAEQNRAPRSIVILWEDMYCNGNMFDFVQQTLLKFVNNEYFNPKRDRIYVAAFNRHRNSEKVLKPITNGFINSRERLRMDISNYQRSKETYAELSNQSDVYPAILEALNQLKKRDEEEIKAVFVISAGRPLESSATNSAVEVQKQARKLHIPLYFYQYAATHGTSSVLEGLGKDTYGDSKTFEGSMKDANITFAADMMTIGFRYLPTHYNGQDYRITYKSNQKRGGKEVALKLRINSQSYSLKMLPAKHNFASWCMAYWYICLIGFLLLVGAIVLIIVYVHKQNKRHAADAAAIGQLKNEHAQSQQMMQNKLNEQAARIEQYKAQNKPEQGAKRPDSQSMMEWMRKKNVFPRIQYTDANNNMHVYEMQKPEILIGRGAEADLKLDNQTVSRKHAKICFAGGGFEISDLGSSNGTIVSGRPVQKTAILNDHDIINLGTALLTFYL